MREGRQVNYVREKRQGRVTYMEMHRSYIMREPRDMCQGEASYVDYEEDQWEIYYERIH